MENSVTLELLQVWTKGKKLIVADHFFWMLGSPMQRSYQGMLQILVHKVFMNDRSLVPICCPDRCYPNAPRAGRLWSTSDLFDCLSAIAEKTDANYCFFIDALDEYHPQGEHVKLVGQLLDLASRSNVKLCVSSRSWTVFECAFGQSDQQIRLEATTRDNIRSFVSSRLLELENASGHYCLGKQKYETERFIEKFLDKADGVFIWAHLVVSSMCDRLLAGANLPELEHCLDEFPAELEEYLHRLVYDRIGSTWRQGQYSETAIALKLATFLQSHVSKDMVLYWLALACTDCNIIERDFYKTLRVQSIEPEDSITIYKKTKGILNQACKDILRDPQPNELSKITESTSGIENYEMVFGHRSMFDFLMTPGMQSLLNEHVPKHFLEGDFMLRLGVAQTKLRFPRSTVTVDASHCIDSLDYITYYVKSKATLNLAQTNGPLGYLDRSFCDHARFCWIDCEIHDPENCLGYLPDYWSIFFIFIRHGLYEIVQMYAARSPHRPVLETLLWATFGAIQMKTHTSIANMDALPTLSWVESLLGPCEYKLRKGRGLGLFARQWALWRLKNSEVPTAESDQDRLWKIAKLLLDHGAVVPREICMNQWPLFEVNNPDACLGMSYHPLSTRSFTERYPDEFCTTHVCIKQSVETLLLTCVPPAHRSELERMLERNKEPNMKCEIIHWQNFILSYTSFNKLVLCLPQLHRFKSHPHGFLLKIKNTGQTKPKPTS